MRIWTFCHHQVWTAVPDAPHESVLCQKPLLHSLSLTQRRLFSTEHQREFNSSCHKRKVVSRCGESVQWIFLLWGTDIKTCWVSPRSPGGWGGSSERQMWLFVPGWVQISDTSAGLSWHNAGQPPLKLNIFLLLSDMLTVWSIWSPRGKKRDSEISSLLLREGCKDQEQDAAEQAAAKQTTNKDKHGRADRVDLEANTPRMTHWYSHVWMRKNRNLQGLW